MLADLYDLKLAYAYTLINLISVALLYPFSHSDHHDTIISANMLSEF